MKARWGSQAEVDAAATAVSGDGTPDPGGRGGGIFCGALAATLGESVATPGEFAVAAAVNRCWYPRIVLRSIPVMRWI